MSTEKNTPPSEADEHFALLEQAKEAGFKIDDEPAEDPSKDTKPPEGLIGMRPVGTVSPAATSCSASPGLHRPHSSGNASS